jgi:predicted secreted protein
MELSQGNSLELLIYTNKNSEKKEGGAGGASCWWLTPVILATQEAEMRGLLFETSPGK